MLRNTFLVLRRAANPSVAALGSVRNLNVHEYISMEIMNQHGIATPKGFVASSAQEAEDIFANKMNHRKFRASMY